MKTFIKQYINIIIHLLVLLACAYNIKILLDIRNDIIQIKNSTKSFENTVEAYQASQASKDLTPTVN